MSGLAGREAGPGRRGRHHDAITAPARLVIRRPRRGWVAGLLSAAMTAVAGLVAAGVALAVLAGVAAVLWRAGDARIPVLVLVCGSVVLAGGGFAFGHASRVLAWWRLPEGPSRLAWPAGANRIQAGLVWETDNTSVTNPAEPTGEESHP